MPVPIRLLQRLRCRELATSFRSRRDPDEKMPLPIGRLHRLRCRELATGIRSRRDPDLICTRHPEEISRSEVSPPHTVGFVGQQVGFVGQQMTMNTAHVNGSLPMIDHLKGGACSFGSAEVQYLKCNLTKPSMTHTMVYESDPIAIKKATNQSMLFVGQRSFSSNSASVRNSSAGSGDRNFFLKNLKSATDNLEVELGTDYINLKAEFASNFHPLFVENCLMLPCKLQGKHTPYLHGPVHGFSKQLPLYLSSLDFMIRVKSLSKEKVEQLVDYIIQRRILIAEDWDNTYGNIEVLRYDASSDTSFVRGECDASFDGLNENGGVAKVAMLIWKGSNLIYADVIEGLDCKDSAGAEVLASLALLIKCKDLGFQRVELWSDSQRVNGVITGAESIYMDMDKQNKNNCLLLRCMPTKFIELVPVFKHREIMFLADELLRLEGSIEDKVEKAIDKWSSKLEGQTVFSVTNTKYSTTEIKKFASTRMRHKEDGYVYKQDHIFYWKVGKGEKYAALLKLRNVFHPHVIHLHMERFEDKREYLRKMMLDLFLNDIITDISAVGTTSTFRIINVPKSEAKTLVVVWDSGLLKQCSEQELCIIVLVEDEKERELMKAAGISEMNVLTYLCFNGVEFKEEEKGKCSKGAKRIKQRKN